MNLLIEHLYAVGGLLIPAFVPCSIWNFTDLDYLKIISVSREYMCYTVAMKGSSSEKLHNFFSHLKTFCYTKGEIILRPQDIPQGIYFVTKGFVRLYSFSKEGKELTLVIYKAGDFFPVVWSFKGSPSMYYFEALSAVEIKRATRESFMEFLHMNYDVFLEINEHILERFQIALKRMQYLAFGNASAKLASILLICGKDFGRENSGEIEIQIPLTHKDIANLVGVTRETVSVELKKFDRRQLVGYHSKLLVIKNQKGLEEESILT